jgi:hypothetical protein
MLRFVVALLVAAWLLTCIQLVNHFKKQSYFAKPFVSKLQGMLAKSFSFKVYRVSHQSKCATACQNLSLSKKSPWT